ncbi:hypothetical protein [Paenibacillus paeoniae]|uniref:Uncharacterized protein n=1 Tax=Paenibacillus paeoniae TaxID=2292705 RepID=A0A371P073_9BACL|nr:hypothetical protein [Paenibacillus paeoniae]REK69329.1 hypothetical protein DX130_24525 [Paenibacillus paeoniae]
MKLEREIRLDRHAYERYCQRVEAIGWQELEGLIAKLLRNFGYRHKDGYVQIGGIWWRGKVTYETVKLYTCYGKTHIDVPEAIRWAERMNDRLRL